MKSFRNLVLAAASVLILSACASVNPELALSEAPMPELKTETLDELLTLPPPARKLTVAVYKFDDLTGQNKPNDNFGEYSRAVTQGGASILINALERAGNQSWFTTVERTSFSALLNERQVIRATREEYGGQSLTPLPPLTYAGIMLEGGIIGYETNTMTGGFGARFLGVGADSKYRRDTVTVYLRAVSIQNGEVLKSVNVSKTIYSLGVQGSAFRFVSFKELLEVEAGLTTNEPPVLATKQAIEKAVYSLIMEGLLKGYWGLKDPSLAQPLLNRYVQQKDGIYSLPSIDATLRDYRNGLTVAPVTQQDPSGPRPSPETRITPPPSPPTTAPTYILPDGTRPIPGAPTAPPLPPVPAPQ